MTTKLLHEALLGHEVDFVVVLDADEFVGTPSRSHFEEMLAPRPSDYYGLIPRRTHVLCPEDIGGLSNPLLRMRWRRRRE